MKNSNLTKESSFLLRMSAWFMERFPPAHWLLALLMTLTALVSSRAQTGELSIEASDIFSFLAVLSFFILLRVFDEHKDFELDCLNHPKRILQSGLISLSNLKILGFLCVAYSLSYSLYLDGGLGSVTKAYVAMMFWACLMAKEFFIGSTLEKYLVPYAISHMLVMLPATYWFMALSSPNSIELSAVTLMLMAFNFCSGAIGEIARKTKNLHQKRGKLFSPTHKV